MRKMIIGPLLAWIALIGPGASLSYSKPSAVPAAWKALYRAIHSKPPVLKTASGQVKATSYSGSRLSVSSMAMMRSQNPRLFDRMFPSVGRIVAADNQIRIALAQGVTPTNGLLPNTPLYNYLEYRRSLSPSRFDYYHPVLGPILAENQQIQTHTNPTPVPGQIIPPPTGGQGDGGNNGGGGGDTGGDGGGGTPSPGPPVGEIPVPPDVPPPPPIGTIPTPPDVPPPPAVPEPGSIVLILAGASVLALGRLRGLRRRRIATAN
jgi:hypothetical protein